MRDKNIFTLTRFDRQTYKLLGAPANYADDIFMTQITNRSVQANRHRLHFTELTGREVPEPADRRLETRRMHFAERHGLVLPVMYDSVQSVLVKQHGYIQWTNCTKNTLLGN